MGDAEKEELLLALEGAANYLRGMAFDPRLVDDIPSACIAKATELDAVVEKHLDGAPTHVAAEADAERWMDVSVDGYPAEPCVVLIARGGKTVMGAFIAGRFWYRNEHVAVLFWRHLPKPPDPTDVHIDAARDGGSGL